jgi:hypothetical protein
MEQMTDPGGSTAQGAGQQTADSDWLDSEWLEKAIRAGLVCYGVVHLLIAWLAFQLALGDHEGEPSAKGAMQEVAEQPMGEVLLWAIAIGMFFLVLWRLLEAALGHRDQEGAKRWWKRADSLVKAVIYGAVGYIAVQVALHAGSGKGRSTTAKLMDEPFGQWLVGLIGLGILVYGANLVRRGFSEKFKEHLDFEGKSGESGKWYVRFGKFGYVAKGVAIAIVGGLFMYAAVEHDPKKSGGLDDALRTVLEQPFGPFLLGVIAIGIGCYGLFCFARARHLSRQ